MNVKTNASLQARWDRAFSSGVNNLYTAYVSKARNAEVWDVEGNRYIDFGSGIAVCNTGHCHPRIVAAVKQQLERFSHTCLMINPYEEAVALAEQLNERVPGETPKKTIFASTGAEAVENAIKIARAYTGRRGVLAFTGGFHGRTHMTMALTGKILPYKKGFGPFPGDIHHLPFPMSLHGVTVEDAIKALRKLTMATIASDDIAAIIIEPVQGEGGFYPAPTALMTFLRNYCDEHGILLIADEIQTGFGRTGKFFCSEYFGVEPDLMTLAKGIAGGYPLAAVVGKEDIMNAPMRGGIGGTYGGSPIGCAAALAVLDVIEEENLPGRAMEIGELFRQRLQHIQDRYLQQVGEIRVNGAMIALELLHDNDPQQPNQELTQKIIAQAANNQLLLLPCGLYGNVIRFLPPLTISHDVVHEGMDYFDNILKQLL